MDNLALACIDCNLHKGPNLTGIDPETNQVTRSNPEQWASTSNAALLLLLPQKVLDAAFGHCDCGTDSLRSRRYSKDGAAPASRTVDWQDDADSIFDT